MAIPLRDLSIRRNWPARIEAAESVSNSSGVYALRNLVDVVPEVAELVVNSRVVELVTAILGPQAFMVHSTLLDKTDGVN